jgi:hypothetical protein
VRRFAGAGAEAPESRGPAAPTGGLRPGGELGSPQGDDPGRADADVGTSVVGTFVGFLIVMTLLLFCAQVLVRLYATSTLTAVATRAAEDVAESPDPSSEVPLAEAAARRQLGTFGATRTRFQWLEVDARRVVLEVRGDSPSLLRVPGGWESITRTVSIRTERFR